MTSPDPDTVLAVWRARVLRWHTNFHLQTSGDDTQGHAARMGQLALMLWPDASRDLLVATLMHDVPEAATADIPGPVKRRMNAVLKTEWLVFEAEAQMALGLPDPPLNDTDADRLNFLDKLDALLWAAAHMRVLTSFWTGQQNWMDQEAARLGLPRWLATHLVMGLREE